jgi:hypothetical protein
MNRTRAERIANRKRMIKRRFGFYHYLRGDDINDSYLFAKLSVDNRQMCSCYMCGHRRKYEGETIQEKQIAEYEKYAMEYEV